MKKLLRFYVYIKPCLPQLIAAIIFGALFGACSGFGMPVIFDKVLRQIFMDQGAQPHSAWYILGIAMLLPTIFAMRAIFGYLSGYLMTFSSLEVLRRLKESKVIRLRFSTSLPPATCSRGLRTTPPQSKPSCFHSRLKYSANRCKLWGRWHSCSIFASQKGKLSCCLFSWRQFRSAFYLSR